MSLKLLFKDELMGFYKSKVMIFLWIGFPLVMAMLHILTPDTGDVPFSIMTAFLVSSLGGTIASVMLVVSIIGEKNNQVYDLFVIRPIKKRNLILSKFLAVFICLVIAISIAIVSGLVIDIFVNGLPSELLIENTIPPFAIALSILAVSCAMGILIGVVSPSILVGVILVIYGGNQVSVLPMLSEVSKISFPPILPKIIEFLGISSPIFIQWLENIPDNIRFSLVIGSLLTVVLLGISIIIFNRKEL
ncbi:MAG: hypothetical protein JSV49_00050 [Thermoplasmata archaeon]|nr:MAG: hypothetical protein JSV49_00050 [Thermoplasmata archaeon]